MTSAFLAYLYRLQYIQRWSLMRNTHPENVAEHSFHVAILAHALCTIAETVYHKDVPTDRIVAAALFHDVAEVLTGDIPTPVKHHNPDILHHFRQNAGPLPTFWP
jgi:5'-deoxynucleotidase